MPNIPILDPVARAASPGSGSIPKDGIAPLVPELAVTDLEESLSFWCGLLGFQVSFDRPAARFAYLVRGRLQVMLCERNGRWEPDDMQRPFGRGINLQMKVDQLAPILDALLAADWPIYEGPDQAWYRTGDTECGQREFLVQDPDGYLLRFAEAQDRGRRNDPDCCVVWPHVKPVLAVPMCVLRCRRAVCHRLQITTKTRRHEACPRSSVSSVG